MYALHYKKEYQKVCNFSVTQCFYYLKDIHNINGLSISPKKEFNIIKIWTKDSVKKYSDLYKDYGKVFSDKNILIKSHK